MRINNEATDQTDRIQCYQTSVGKIGRIRKKIEKKLLENLIEGKEFRFWIKEISSTLLFTAMIIIFIISSV